jgi:FkbM family methyltransferase
MLTKEWVRKLLLNLPFAVTANIKNDQLSLKIMQQLLTIDSCCIDVGCHKGEILDVMMSISKNGSHYAFEPIPNLFNNLVNKFEGQNVKIFDIALSNQAGESTFNFVVSNPAYSGLLKRKYDRADEIDTSINVKVDTIDNVIGLNKKIDFIKIDTEGGEYGVLKGGEKLIEKWKPHVLFEFGLGASDIYNTTAKMMYDFFNDLGMNIYSQTSFIKNKQKLTLTSFNNYYTNKIEYIFLATKD